jgi:hypothetical protein
MAGYSVGEAQDARAITTSNTAAAPPERSSRAHLLLAEIRNGDRLVEASFMRLIIRKILLLVK